VAVVEDHAVTLRAIDLVRDVLKECEDPYRGIIFAVPVSHFVNLSEG